MNNISTIMMRRIPVTSVLRRQMRQIHFSSVPLNTERREQGNNDDNRNDTSNIMNILNELNNEDDFNSRSVRYRTTASQLMEEMAKKNAVEEKQDVDLEGQMETMSLEDNSNVQEEEEEEKKKKRNLMDKKKQISIERYLHTHHIHKQLIDAEFSEKQAKLIMDLILSQLEINTNKMIAKHAPELDLENENYLFQAAQQELKSEVSSSRESDLNLLVNSSILLKRSFQSLEDELGINYKLMDNSMKLELNQFKHENNLHSKKLDLKTQDLNNKIITDLVGELRSYTESLRWQLTRSALLTIFTLVFLTISSYTFIKNAEEEEQQTQEVLKSNIPEVGSQQIISKMIKDDGVDDDEEELALDERL